MVRSLMPSESSTVPTAPPRPSDQATQDLITVSNLRKRFGDTEVLRGIDLTIQRGEMVALTGRSGSGKSTLLHIIGGLDYRQGGHSYEGKVELLGHDIAQLTDAALSALRNRHIGFVFQAFHLLAHLSCLDNVLPAPGGGSDRTRTGAPAAAGAHGAAGLRLLPRHAADRRPGPGAHARRTGRQANRRHGRDDRPRSSRHPDAALAGDAQRARGALDRRTPDGRFS